MLNVLVAIRDPIADIGLRTVLDGADDMNAIRLDAEAQDVPAAVAEARPDVLLLDVAYRRADPRLVPGLMERHPDLHILVFVDHSAEKCGLLQLLSQGGRAKLEPEVLAMVDDCCLTSLRQRAQGCLPATSSPEAVLYAVRAVARGEVAAAPWLAVVASSIAKSAGGTMPAITPRELEVLARLGEGLSNKQISKELGLKEQTVKNHVGRIKLKLGVESRLEAGLLAAKSQVRLVRDDT